MIVVIVVCFLSLCFRRLKDSGTKETKETSASNPRNRGTILVVDARVTSTYWTPSPCYSTVLRGTQIPVEIVRTRVRNCFYAGRLSYDLWNVICRTRGSFRALVSNFKHSSITRRPTNNLFDSIIYNTIVILVTRDNVVYLS